MRRVLLASLVLSLATATTGCASRHWYDSKLYAFDGHEMWIGYECEHAGPLMVRVLGGWADASTPDGSVHRLKQEDDVPHYLGGGYEFRSDGATAAWTVPGATPETCKARFG